MYAEFDITLVTGNDEIDGQHKEWIDRINKLLECYENGGFRGHKTDYIFETFTATNPGVMRHIL